MTTHWAAHYIGRPWTPEFNCLGLVREVFAIRHDMAMPDEATEFLERAYCAGWRRVETHARVDDVVLMDTLNGKHIGVMIEANSRLGVLHNDGHLTERGPVGHVSFTTLATLLETGASGFEFWRRL